MELFCLRCVRIIILFWTFYRVVFAQSEAPTATLTAPNGAVERSYIHLTCRVTGTPKPSITWYKNGAVVTARARAQRITLPDGELLRLGRILKSRHEGDYECKATNAAGSVTSQTASLTIYKANSAPSGFPKIGKNPGYASVTSGDDATFSCIVTGNPTPVISWMKDNKPLDLSNPRISTPNPGTVNVTDVQSSDAGYYECVATNNLGMVYSQRATLIYKVSYKKPAITSPPQPVTVDPETVVYLNCSATGNPRPSIVWERDGIRLAGGNDGVLAVQDIQKSGNYTCIAENNRGRAQASAYVTVRKLPFAPTRPTATQITADFLTITWQPGGGTPVDSYTLYYRAESTSQWTVIKDIRGRTSMSLNDLQPYTNYQFRLFALNSLGTSKPSPLAEFRTAQKAPGTSPRNIQAKGLSDTSFEATWLPPSQPNGKILGYRLYYVTDSKLKIDQWLYRATAVNQTQITGLLKKTTYYFKVIAYNSAGEGPLSDLFAVKTAQGAPGQPELVNVIVLSPRTIQITWQAPMYPGNGVIGYEVYYNKSTADLDTTLTVSDRTLGKEISDLRPYTFYQVQVAAKSYGLTGPKSFVQVVQTLEDAPSAAPVNIRSKSLDSTSLEISWDPPPPGHRNGRITNYTIKYREKGERANYVNVDGIKSSIRLHNLKKYTTYFVWLSASTSVGTGPVSNKHTFSTAEDVPSGAPRQLKFRVVNSSTIVVRWSEPLQEQQDGRIQGYSVFYQKVDDQGNQLNPPANIEVKYSESEDSLSVVLTELEAETTYHIEVAAYTIKGDGARSVPALAKTSAKLPDAPYVFSSDPATSSNKGVTIKWRTAISSQNVKNYKLRYGKSLQRLRQRDIASLKMKEMTFLPRTREHEFRDLNLGVWYLFTVSIQTKAGWSPEAQFWVKMPPGAPTGPPLQVRASPVSSTEIRVTWLEPDEWKRNGPLTGYSVVYNPLNRRTQSLVKNITTASQTRVILTGLKMFTEYEIRVRALGQKGAGPLSLPVVEKTKEDVPESCRELKVNAGGSDSVVLNWQPPVTDAGITKYKISYSGTKSYKEKGELKQLSHNRDVKLDAVRPGLQSHKLEGLVPHTTYKIQLSALNSMGEGPKIELSLKTDKGRPPALQRPEIVEDELSDEFVPIVLEPASERNGPISYYIVIVVPLSKSNQLPKDRTPDDFFKEVRRRRETAKRDIEEPYIAAKFSPSDLPKRFNVGDKNFKNNYGYYNKKLVKGAYYTMFTRAYVKNNKGNALYTSSPFVTPIKFGASPKKEVNTGARQDPEEHTGGGLNLTFVIIPIVAVIVITAVVVIAVMVCRRRNRRSKKSKSADEEKSEPTDPVEMKRMTIQTPAMMDHPPIPVSELLNHNNMLKAENNSKFTQEYESIEPGETFTSDASIQDYNKSKNRYPNILAFDHSRVRLATTDGIVGSDYVNANFCDGYRKENAYIATQGPLEETIDDFWRMIWEYKTFTIVMLTELEERGRIKCEQYWPSEGAELYGDIEVTVTDWIEFANYTITTLQICKEGAPQPREVKHFQFTGWPDHGVPPHPTPFLAFLRRVRFYNPTDAGPIVVHCSGGVGRTACFIVIDSMLERVKHENTVDIYGHVTVLRTQRNFMVQTEEQYIFIHDALLEAVSCGNTEVHARNLLHHIKRLTEPGEGGMAGLGEEFRKLSNPNQVRRLKQGAGSLTVNRSKNRLANILPYESTRVQLLAVRGTEGSDYINASFIDGYRQRGAYIATQGPLQDTVDDFWRMLMEQNSNIIVMLTQLHEGDRERCYKYWPTDRSAKHGYYVVDPVTEQEFPHFVIRDFKVKDIMSGTVRNIKQFHFYGWTDSSSKSGEGILDLIGQVQRTYEQQDEEGPITVHCSDGVGRTGVFCALCIVLERMRSEGVVDLFQTLKLLRTQRPNMIQNQDQYLFCYQKALEYLSSFDHYAV